MSSTRIPPLATIRDLGRLADGPVRWVWDGYVAFGSITLFTSRWKSGKTTLLSVLLSRLNGGGTLAGSAVAAAPAVVVSEETPTLWLARHAKVAFPDGVRWLCQPFIHQPSRDEWLELLQQLHQSCPQPSLIVIDPLAAVLPGADENSAGAIINALAPLRHLTARGSAVLLLHHPSKGRSLDPRGSGALAGFADILMELDMPAQATAETRRRWLRARGRHDVVPTERLIELTAAGTDYLVCDPVAEDCADGWQTIRWVLEDATAKYTRDEIRSNWPEHRDKPHPGTLWRWLESAQAQGWVKRSGDGRSRRPFKYWLPEREKHFLPDLPDFLFNGFGSSTADDLNRATEEAERRERQREKRKLKRQMKAASRAAEETVEGQAYELNG